MVPNRPWRGSQRSPRRAGADDRRTGRPRPGRPPQPARLILGRRTQRPPDPTGVAAPPRSSAAGCSRIPLWCGGLGRRFRRLGLHRHAGEVVDEPAVVVSDQRDPPTQPRLTGLDVRRALSSTVIEASASALSPSMLSIATCSTSPVDLIFASANFASRSGRRVFELLGEVVGQQRRHALDVRIEVGHVVRVDAGSEPLRGGADVLAGRGVGVGRDLGTADQSGHAHDDTTHREQRRERPRGDARAVTVRPRVRASSTSRTPPRDREPLGAASRSSPEVQIGSSPHRTCPARRVGRHRAFDVRPEAAETPRRLLRRAAGRPSVPLLARCGRTVCAACEAGFVALEARRPLGLQRQAQAERRTDRCGSPSR